MNIDKPPISTIFADTIKTVNRPWLMWFNSIYNRFTQLFTINNEAKIKVYEQNAEPTLTENKVMAYWVDTNDSNRVYLIYRRGDSDQVKIELV
jgi:hypothetical protein